MHDLLHDMCLRKAREQNFVGVVACKDNMPSQRSQPLAFFQGIDDHVSSHKSPSKICSFLFLSRHSRSLSSSKRCLYNAKLVRVLLLENITLEYSLNELGSLALLSCLSFQGSVICGEIPKSIRDLPHLEVLDLKVESFHYRRTWKFLNSSWSLELPSLRHFYVYGNVIRVQRMLLKAGSSRFVQTLWSVMAGFI
ncbi:hypothetical protein AMTRI_Chr10g6840 [Amborella trichopoda]